MSSFTNDCFTTFKGIVILRFDVQWPDDEIDYTGRNTYSFLLPSNGIQTEYNVEQYKCDNKKQTYKQTETHRDTLLRQVPIRESNEAEVSYHYLGVSVLTTWKEHKILSF